MSSQESPNIPPTPRTTDNNENPQSAPPPDPPKIHNYRGCPAVKRLLREAAEMAEPTEEFSAQPLDDNLFEWHFTIRGPQNSEFEHGIYHGRILFPSEYPMAPPRFAFYTPNGRFSTGVNICLSISSYHPETWLPSWSIRTALVAIVSFMNTPGNLGNIGELHWSLPDRRNLAKKSIDWKCPSGCGPNRNLVKPRTGVSNPTEPCVTTSSTPTPTTTASDHESKVTGNEISDNLGSLNDQTRMDKNLNSSLEGSETNFQIQAENLIQIGQDNHTESDLRLAETISFCSNGNVETEIVGEGQSQNLQGEMGSSERQTGVDSSRVQPHTTDFVPIVPLVVNRETEGEGTRNRTPVIDFAIGLVIALIVGLFFRRLFSVLPNLEFGIL